MATILDSQFMEDEDEEQVSNEAYDKMKKMYTKREYRTNRSSV